MSLILHKYSWLNQQLKFEIMFELSETLLHCWWVDVVWLMLLNHQVIDIWTRNHSDLIKTSSTITFDGEIIQRFLGCGIMVMIHMKPVFLCVPVLLKVSASTWAMRSLTDIALVQWKRCLTRFSSPTSKALLCAAHPGLMEHNAAVIKQLFGISHVNLLIPFVEFFRDSLTLWMEITLWASSITIYDILSPFFGVFWPKNILLWHRKLSFGCRFLLLRDTGGLQMAW